MGIRFTGTARGASHFSDSLHETGAVMRESFSFADLGFDGLGRGKLPVAMRLGARVTGMQFTNFPDRCPTSRTRYG